MPIRRRARQAPPGTFYNKYFPGHFLAMPPPLTDGRVEYTDGTKPTADQLARDVTAFLAWAAEPHMEARKRIGLQVIIFLIVFAGPPLFHQEEGVEVGRGALIAPDLVAWAARRNRSRSMRGPFALLFLPPAVAGDACAQSSSKVERIEIVEAGIYRAETAGIEQAPGTATRQRNILSDTRLLVSTTRVEAKLGMHFGMRYRVVGTPNLATVKLVSVTQYPAPGLKNPKGDKPQTRGEHSLFATIGQINYRGYMFEHEWEMVAGAWTLELWDGQRKLASQTFTVTKP